MAHTLKISDGTTTVNFLGGNYAVAWEQWAPKRARRVRGELGGALYENVTEQIGIIITGTDAGDAWDKLETLSELLDQAERWHKGEAVSAVYFEYWPANSDLAASVKAVIVSPPPGDTFIRLPSHSDVRMADGVTLTLGSISDPILLRFVRRGLWLGATESKSSSASTGNPAQLTTASFTLTPVIAWPYDVQLDLDQTASGFIASNIWLFLQGAANKLELVEAEDSTKGSGVTTETIAAASSGEVARVDSEADTTEKSFYLDFAMAAGSRYGFYAMVRNRSASTVTWTIRSEFSNPDEGNVAPGVTHVIAPGDTVRQMLYLGSFSIPEPPSGQQRITIYAQNDVTGGGSDADDLDFDYVIGIILDQDARVIAFNHGASASGDSSLYIEHRLDDSLVPISYLDASGVTWEYPSYDGNLLPMAAGGVISAILAGNDQAGANWVLLDGGGNALNATLNATQWAAYLTPR